MQRIGRLLFLSISCITIHPESNTELPDNRDKKLQTIKKEVRCIPQYLSNLASQWFDTKDDHEKKIVYTDVLALIEDLTNQYDESRPEPNFLKLILEKISWGHYQRPTGSLTKKAFALLEQWMKEHSEEELQVLYTTVFAELKDAKETRKKALLIIMSKVRFELERRYEENKEE